MTVRADINGRYANRMYAYEPSDISLCKCCRWEICIQLFGGFVCLSVGLKVSCLSLSNKQHAEGQEAPEVRAVSTRPDHGAVASDNTCSSLHTEN